MSEQVATAEPAAEVAGGQNAPEATPPATTAAPAADAPSSEQSLQLTLEEIWEKNHAPPKPKAEEAPAQAAPEGDQPSTAPEPAQSSPAIAAPQSWSPESQAKWSSLPPDLQQLIADRELEATKQISRQGAELKTYQPLREVFDWVRSRGVPQGQEHEIIRGWATAQHMLDDPATRAEAFQRLAQSYGVDLAQLAGPPKQQSTETSAVDDLFKDSRVDALNQEIATLKSQLQRLGGVVSTREQAEQQRLQQQQAREAEAVAKAIENFSKGKPYFKDIEDDLVHEVNFIKSREPGLSTDKVLEKAYDRALYANAQIRERVLSDQRKAEAEKAAKELAAQQAAAKKHQAMNVRTGIAASTPTFDGRWDDPDKLGAIFDRVQAGR